MYKKITHTIVEEHFEHPVSANIKSSIDRKLGSYEIKSQIPTTEILNYNDFLSSIQSFANTYGTDLSAMIDTISSNKSAFVTKFEELVAMSDNLGNLTKPLWYSEFGEQINLAMRSIIVYTALAIHSAEVGGDTGYYKLKLSNIMNELATSIMNYNSNIGGSELRQQLNSIVEFLIQKLEAAAGNKPNSAQLSNSINQAFSTFGNILANAAKTRFPDRFTYS